MDLGVRLKDFFLQNTKDDTGFVVSVIGPWGSGKTYFWNNFINKCFNDERKEYDGYYYLASKINTKKIFDKQYTYVSLFGINNLEELKTYILTNTYKNPTSTQKKSIDIITTGIKTLKDMRINQAGINISTGIIHTYLFDKFENTIICFDDFERISTSLDIKDLMGFINFLNLEKNCKIVLLMNNEKIADDEKNIYEEYKEKVIDETFRITSIKNLLESEKELSEESQKILISFSEKANILNFRFFQKVIKLYLKILEEHNRADQMLGISVRNNILKRVMQGYFIENYGCEYEYSWKDSKIFGVALLDRENEKLQEEWKENKVLLYESIKEDFSIFFQKDTFIDVFELFFSQKTYKLDLSNLIDSEEILEKYEAAREQISQILYQLRSFELTANFGDNFYNAAKTLISVESLSNFNFYVKSLNEFGKPDLACQLEQDVKLWIDNSIETDSYSFFERYMEWAEWADGKEQNIFHQYIYTLQEANPAIGSKSLINVVLQLLTRNGWNPYQDIPPIKKATSDDWEKLLFQDLPESHEYKALNQPLLFVIQKIIDQPFDQSLTPKIKQDIYSVLIKKGKSSDSNKISADHMLKFLKQKFGE